MNLADKSIKIIAAYFQIALLVCSMQAFAQDEPSTSYSKKDTSYISLADSRIIKITRNGKAPRVTLSMNFNYNIGHLDLAASENTSFRKDDFINGRNFGTRYGYGVTLAGKFSLHKQGNIRLNVTASYNSFRSNFVISESPEGKVNYNAFGGALGIENSFNPDRIIKPYIGADIVVSFINGKATYTTDTADFNLTIKNSIRVGASFNLGFEYALSNKVGLNIGYRLTYANLIGKSSKTSSNLNEAYLNDEKVTSGIDIPFAGWRQFLYSTFSAGINFYFGMKNKK